jgi:hypothetical protein
MILAALSLSAILASNSPIIQTPARNVAPAGGGSSAAFEDDFNRASSADLGANWTEAINQAEISNNDSYRIVTGSFAVVTSIYNTSTGSTTQYIKITFAGIDVQYPWIVFRYTDASSGYYTIQFDGNTGSFDWLYFSSDADTTGDTIGSGTFSQDLVGDTVGFSITGTGTSTVVRGWHTPTNLPSAADNWDGDTTPNVTLNDDPAVSLSGQKVGLGGQVSVANTVRITHFWGGGL